MLISDDHKSNFATFQILLVTQVLVCSQQQIEPCRLCCGDQVAIGKSAPATFNRLLNHVVREGVTGGGAGTPLSKRMSIGGNVRRTRSRGSIKAARCEFQDCNHLLPRQMKPVHNLADRCSGLKIVKHYGDGGARFPEHPGTGTFARDALHGGAL